MKKGQRVKVIKKHDCAKPGMIGIYCGDKRMDERPGIIFDKPFPGGHTLSGLCEDGYGHWIPEDHLEPINNYKREKLSYPDWMEPGYKYLCKVRDNQYEDWINDVWVTAYIDPEDFPFIAEEDTAFRYAEPIEEIPKPETVTMEIPKHLIDEVKNLFKENEE